MNESVSAKGLPEVLPIFPLTGTLLLPGTTLPLHIFEPRYRNLVEDALSKDKVFGMIQPFVPREDNRPLPGAEKETPELYHVGCAGVIEKWEKTPDGRYGIYLRGVNRFRIEEELPVHRGYRRVKARYDVFSDVTTDENWHCDRPAIRLALEGYAKAMGLRVQLEEIDRIQDVELVNGLSVSLPLHPAEKQALLEAPSLDDRSVILLDLLKLEGASEGTSTGPTT
ncbi:MAG: peptidase S16, partial [Deltaproteobacteria bacterium]|nr:peptidase S16 [Deltaproteobacteria bacterium]